MLETTPKLGRYYVRNVIRVKNCHRVPVLLIRSRGNANFIRMKGPSGITNGRRSRLTEESNSTTPPPIVDGIPVGRTTTIELDSLSDDEKDDAEMRRVS